MPRFESWFDHVKEKKACDCTGTCGVGRDYHQIWLEFQSRHGSNPDAPFIHRKWKSLGRQAVNGGLRNMTGV